MKELKIKFILLTIFLIVSCNSDNGRDIQKAATKICTCLDKTIKLNQALIDKETQNDEKIIEIMEKISSSAEFGFSCVDRTLKQYKIKDNTIARKSLDQLLEKDCPDAAEMLARE